MDLGGWEGLWIEPGGVGKGLRCLVWGSRGLGGWM